MIRDGELLAAEAADTDNAEVESTGLEAAETPGFDSCFFLEYGQWQRIYPEWRYDCHGGRQRNCV